MVNAWQCYVAAGLLRGGFGATVGLMLGECGANVRESGLQLDEGRFFMHGCRWPKLGECRVVVLLARVGRPLGECQRCWLMHG